MLASLRRLLGTLRHRPPKPVDCYEGECDVCGSFATFPCFGDWRRESYRCPVCGASVRYRAQARAILDCYSKTPGGCLADLVEQPAFRALRIYEPGITGPFRSCLSRCPHYRQSYYWEGQPSVEPHEGVENQNLQDLSMPSGCVDLVITSDIFEHVRKPLEGFSEIARILTPGGRHIFTVPLSLPLPDKTVYRIDTSRDVDVYVMEPVYHGCGAGGRSLVYTDFGADILEMLDGVGMTASLHRHSCRPDWEDVLTVVAEKRP